MKEDIDERRWRPFDGNVGGGGDCRGGRRIRRRIRGGEETAGRKARHGDRPLAGQSQCAMSAVRSRAAEDEAKTGPHVAHPEHVLDRSFRQTRQLQSAKRRWVAGRPATDLWRAADDAVDRRKRRDVRLDGHAHERRGLAARADGRGRAAARGRARAGGGRDEDLRQLARRRRPALRRDGQRCDRTRGARTDAGGARGADRALPGRDAFARGVPRRRRADGRRTRGQLRHRLRDRAQDPRVVGARHRGVLARRPDARPHRRDPAGLARRRRRAERPCAAERGGDRAAAARPRG